MPVLHVALLAILNGPVVRNRTVRRVLAEHLDYVRRTGGKQEPPPTK